MIGDGREGELRIAAHEWQALVDALQVLVLVADAAVREPTRQDPADAYRDVAVATMRVLAIVRGILPFRMERQATGVPVDLKPMDAKLL